MLVYTLREAQRCLPVNGQNGEEGGPLLPPTCPLMCLQSASKTPRHPPSLPAQGPMYFDNNVWQATPATVRHVHPPLGPVLPLCCPPACQPTAVRHVHSSAGVPGLGSPHQFCSPSLFSPCSCVHNLSQGHLFFQPLPCCTRAAGLFPPPLSLCPATFWPCL